MTQAPGSTTVQSMTIARPEGWLDKSMLVLSAERPGPTGVSATLVVTLEPAPEGLGPAAALEQFVDRQLDGMRVTLDGFAEVSRRHAEAADPTAELTIEWLSSGIPITQRLWYAHADAATLKVATGTAGRGDFAAAEPAFRAMLGSFRIS